MSIRNLFTEAIKTHPNIKALTPLFKKAGYKAKVQYGELNIPFLKGVTEDEAIAKFLAIAPGEWKEEKRAGSSSIYTQGDIGVSFGTFSGKVFAGVRTN